MAMIIPFDARLKAQLSPRKSSKKPKSTSEDVSLFEGSQGASVHRIDEDVTFIEGRLLEEDQWDPFSNDFSFLSSASPMEFYEMILALKNLPLKAIRAYA